MRVISIPLARSLAFIELDSLNRRGELTLPIIVEKLVSSFGFHKYPTKPEEFDTGKGIELHNGTIDSDAINRLTIFPQLIYAESPLSTEAAKGILLRILKWSEAELGSTYDESLVRRWGNISQVVFSTEEPLLPRLSPALASAARKITDMVQASIDSSLVYVPIRFDVGHDPSVRSAKIASFTIQPRANTAISENIYFSEAPISTEQHIAILQELDDNQ